MQTASCAWSSAAAPDPSSVIVRTATQTAFAFARRILRVSGESAPQRWTLFVLCRALAKVALRGRIICVEKSRNRLADTGRR